jgi:hypothetical protein
MCIQVQGCGHRRCHCCCHCCCQNALPCPGQRRFQICAARPVAVPASVCLIVLSERCNACVVLTSCKVPESASLLHSLHRHPAPRRDSSSATRNSGDTDLIQQD